MTSYSITEQAYVKLILHTAKYPDKPVFGLLAGETGNDVIRIVDTFPLFHQPFAAAPLEVATTMVEQHCASQNPSLKIVGLYKANALLKDHALDAVTQKIANKIDAESDRACVLLVENDQLGDSRSLALQLLLKDVKRGWTAVNGKLKAEKESAVESVTKALVQGIHHEIHDFDEHLDDITKDWRNPMFKY